MAVMRRRIDAHRHLVGVFVGDLLVHLEQIAVTLADGVLAQALDGIGKVQIDAPPARADAATVVALFLGRAGGDVTRGQIAEARILALQIIIALILGDLVGRTPCPPSSWAPSSGRRCAATRT